MSTKDPAGSTGLGTLASTLRSSLNALSPHTAGWPSDTGTSQGILLPLAPSLLWTKRQDTEEKGFSGDPGFQPNLHKNDTLAIQSCTNGTKAGRSSFTEVVRTFPRLTGAQAVQCVRTRTPSSVATIPQQPDLSTRQKSLAQVYPVTFQAAHPGRNLRSHSYHCSRRQIQARPPPPPLGRQCILARAPPSALRSRPHAEV